MKIFNSAKNNNLDKCFQFYLTYQWYDAKCFEQSKVTLSEFKEKWSWLQHTDFEVSLASVKLGEDLYHFTSFGELIKCIEDYDHLVMPEAG